MTHFFKKERIFFEQNAPMFQVVDETDLRRKTSVANDVAAKVNVTTRTSNAMERFNASAMDQVNLSDDENSPARRAQIRGKHFSEFLE